MENPNNSETAGTEHTIRIGDNNSGEFTFLDSLYIARERISSWILVVLISGVVCIGIYFLLLRYHKDSFASPGPWTALIIVTSAPAAFFLWAARDRSKTKELHNESKRQELERSKLEQESQQHRDQIRFRNAEHAQRVFDGLQNRATGDNDALQAAAIHQLRPYILGLSEALLPEELSGPQSPFRIPSLAIVRALLDDRTWERRWAKRLADLNDSDEESDYISTQSVINTARSPVALAIEAVLTSGRLPVEDLSRWNFQRLWLSRISLEDYNLGSTNFGDCRLQSAVFSRSRLFGAKFDHAWLTEANFSDAVLSGASFVGARLPEADLSKSKSFRADFSNSILFRSNFQDADLNGALFRNARMSQVNFQNVDLRNADLRGVELGSVKLDGANLQDTRIDKKWQKGIDWGRINHRGHPNFVEEGAEPIIEDDIPF